jgi:hypothetical protein
MGVTYCRFSASSITLSVLMEALKAEIAIKRKALQDDPLISSRPTKYMKNGEIEKLREEQELKEKEARAAKKVPEKQHKSQVWLTHHHIEYD